MAIAAGATVTLKNGCCHMMTVECVLESSASGDGCCNQCNPPTCETLVRCVWCEGKRTRRENFAEASLQEWVKAD